MPVLLYSDDLILLDSLKEKITFYESKVIENIDKISEFKSEILILDYGCCYKVLPNIVYRVKQQGIRILLLDNTPTFEKGTKALNIGVQGYGNTLLSSVYLNSAIETLLSKMIWIYPEFTTSLIQGFKKKETIPPEIQIHLTARELDTALLIKDGLTNNEISQSLEISINTVKSHVKNIYEKLNVKNRLSLSLLFKSL